MHFFRFFLFTLLTCCGLATASPNTTWTHGPIDAVYTWVNNNDRTWQREKRKYAKQAQLAWDSLKKTRFQDRNELKYSLRSIAKYAPFIRRIFIVTAGQYPKWLKRHPKITVVHHKQIFPWDGCLPTFNSMAIESNLHRIPGLSEFYIYFNDDVFLGRQTTPFTFFNVSKDRKAQTRVFLTKRAIPTSKKQRQQGSYRSSAFNSSQAMKQKFAKKQTYYLHDHTPFPSIKSHVLYVEKIFRNIFREVSSHRFRCHSDYTITNGLIPYTSLQNRKGVVSFDHSSISYSFRGKVKRDKHNLERIFQSKPTFFCIQDASEKKNKEAEACLQKFFEKYFPKKADWEK